MAHHVDGETSDSRGPVDRDDLLEALFHEALELDETERADYARRQCAGDPELAEELCALLSAHGSVPTCLEQPAWGEDGPCREDVPGDTIGPYHLIRTLGEGGMGTVYLAQQLRPLRRSVALKLIKPGMDTREVVSRFDAERQALAQLNHPHIAAVYDAGITPRGRPYFAMEFVPGERISRYCDSRKLPLRKRLLLFRSVCDAVHHAHQNGVIHRDLKPGNILVTEVDGQPVPKIIDFGVSKAMDSSAGGRGTLCTRSGQIIGTPSYMSPEQAGAFPATVDSRTDVYSLGVLLNELLTGFLPYDLGSLRGADDALVRRRLSEVEVVRPALRVALLGLRARKVAALRDCDPRSLSRQLKGDLDWIVLKALERDPEARYASASELAADVANHLDGEPVAASSPGALYRARKLIAKNRGVVGSVAAVIMTGFVALMAFAMSEVGRNDDLVHENEQLVTTHDAEMKAVLDREDTLLAERGEAADEFPYSTTVIRNVGDHPLMVGEIVELVGVGDVHPLGGMVVDVVRAESGSSRPPLGSMDGRWVAESGQSGQALRLAEPVPPGDYGVAVTHGLFARVRVDGSCGEIRANDVLGVSAVPGLACLHSGEGAVVGFALDEWTVSQRGLIRAFVAPAPALMAGPVATLGPGATSSLELESLGRTPEDVVNSSLSALESDAVLTQDPALADDALLQDGVSALMPGGLDTTSTYGKSAVLPGAGAVMLVSQGAPIVDGEEAGGETGTEPDSSSDSAESGDDSSSVAIATPDGVVVIAGTAAGEDSSANGIRNGGVGRRVPGETGGTMNTPPGSGDTPPHGGGVGPDQGDGQVFDLTNGVGDDSDGGGGGHGDEGTGTDKTPGGGGHTGLVQLWGDVDGDGLLDVLMHAGKGGRGEFVLQHNVGQGAFEDITDWSGLGAHASSIQRVVAWVDVEQDGHLDLLALGDDGRLQLFRGRGDGRFGVVFEAAGLVAAEGVQEAEAFDIDGNGAADVRVSTVGDGVSLLLNDGHGRFSLVVLRAADEMDVATSGRDSATPPGRQDN